MRNRLRDARAMLGIVLTSLPAALLIGACLLGLGVGLSPWWGVPYLLYGITLGRIAYGRGLRPLIGDIVVAALWWPIALAYGVIHQTLPDPTINMLEVLYTPPVRRLLQRRALPTRYFMDH